jgi:hypothetical protein
MSKRGANFIPVEPIPLGEPKLVDQLHDLGATIAEQANAMEPHSGLVDDVRSQIKELRKLEAQILAGAAETKAANSTRIHEIEKKLIENRDGFNPFFQLVLEAAQMHGGSLGALDTAAASEFLAADIIAADQQFRQYDASAPAITIADNPAFLSRHQDLKINYGFTDPNQGLVPKMMDLQIAQASSGDKIIAPHPVIEIPTLKKPVLKAVTAPSWNSHYLKSHGNSVEIGSHGRKSRIRLYPGEHRPKAGELALPLPIGSLSLKEPTPTLMTYDSQDGGLETVYAPPGFSGRPTKTAAFIGPRAVRKGLVELYNTSNSPQNEYDPDVVKDMVLFVANSLGIIKLKRRQFTPAKHRPKHRALAA